MALASLSDLVQQAERSHDCCARRILQQAAAGCTAIALQWLLIWLLMNHLL